MTGFIFKKYHVAVLEENESFLARMIISLKSWYQNKIVVEPFTSSREMFEAINVNEVKNKPFDVAVLNSEGDVEQMILKRSNPSLKVIRCQDEQSLKKETAKILL